jgi:hypothetical protein
MDYETLMWLTLLGHQSEEAYFGGGSAFASNGGSGDGGTTIPAGAQQPDEVVTTAKCPQGAGGVCSKDGWQDFKDAWRLYWRDILRGGVQAARDLPSFGVSNAIVDMGVGDLVEGGIRCRDGEASQCVVAAVSVIPEGKSFKAAREVTEIAFVTNKGARYANIAANIGGKEFQSNLVSNGYKIVKETIGSNGPVTVLSNGTNSYTIYTATSTGELSAQLTNAAGEIVSKIRLAGP